MVKVVSLFLVILAWAIGAYYSATISTDTFPALVMYFSYTSWSMIVILMAFVFANINNFCPEDDTEE